MSDRQTFLAALARGWGGTYKFIGDGDCMPESKVRSDEDTFPSDEDKQAALAQAVMQDDPSNRATCPQCEHTFTVIESEMKQGGLHVVSGCLNPHCEYEIETDHFLPLG